MPKRLLVRTPQTKDGVNLKYDKDKKPLYRESIVELRAKKNLESLNAKLPTHLRHEFAEIEVPDEQKSAPNQKLLERLAELESMKENKTLQERITQLEAELAEANGGSTESVRGTVPEVVAKIKEATTKEDVNALAEGDVRKGVQDAAEKRIAQIETGE
jgi:hypothetical protein